MAPQHQIPTEIFEQLSAAELECKMHGCLNGTASKTRQVWDSQRAAGADLSQFVSLRGYFEAPPASCSEVQKESPPASATDSPHEDEFRRLVKLAKAKNPQLTERIIRQLVGMPSEIRFTPTGNHGNTKAPFGSAWDQYVARHGLFGMTGPSEKEETARYSPPEFRWSGSSSSRPCCRSL